MNFYFKALIYLIAAGLAAFLIHTYLLIPQLDLNDPYGTVALYSFIVIATYLSIAAIKYAHSLAANHMALVFLATMMIKMGAAVLLFPQLIDDEVALSKADLLQFLVPYFLFLFMETYVVIKWLNDK